MPPDAVCHEWPERAVTERISVASACSNCRLQLMKEVVAEHIRSTYIQSHLTQNISQVEYTD